MADIFDDVDDILKETTHHDEEEKSFNEAELQDIMMEIEDLEKEFDEEGPASETTAFQEEMVPKKTDILNFDKTSPTPMTQGQNVAFKAAGSMNLELDFTIGEETAKLSIDPSQGLSVKFADVCVWISQEEGCIITMKNGMKFTIPLSSEEKTLKKKSA